MRANSRVVFTRSLLSLPLHRSVPEFVRKAGGRVSVRKLAILAQATQPEVLAACRDSGLVVVPGPRTGSTSGTARGDQEVRLAG